MKYNEPTTVDGQRITIEFNKGQYNTTITKEQTNFVGSPPVSIRVMCIVELTDSVGNRKTITTSGIAKTFTEEMGLSREDIIV